MKIYQKLLLGFILISLLVLLVGSISIFSDDQISNDISQLVNSSLKEAEGAAKMNYALQKTQLNAQRLLSERLREIVEPAEAASAIVAATRANMEIHKAIVDFEKWLIKGREATNQGVVLAGKAGEKDQVKEEKEDLLILNNIGLQFTEYKAALSQFIVLTKEDLDDADEWLKDVVNPLLINVTQRVHSYQEDTEGELHAEAGEIREAAEGNTKIMLTTTAIALCMALILGLSSAHAITKPLVDLKIAVTAIGAGKLDTRLVVNSNDEIGVLLDSFNNMAKDIESANSELKNSQHQLLQTAKLASIGEISAGLAHELNQPLGTIGMIAEFATKLLDDSNFDRDNFRQKMQKITTQVDRATRIITHLKIFSRKEEHESEEKDINWIIEESLVLLKEPLKLCDISLDIELGDRLPKIICNYIQIDQVLINLIKNAQDSFDNFDNFDNSYNKLITVRSYEKNETICIDVEDNGSGMSESVVDRVFDPFFTTKPVGKGAGLGMSISYGIVKEHKGILSVTTREGKGTLFTVALPMKELT
ncbi:hypothetical protein A9Q99_04685 [Gammaproteobacteria bacterium 45_16_T64]|nr:hypothetical protein A9Q99_04685 [Gammaproteobacteria bacterium 45_16_T64]